MTKPQFFAGRGHKTRWLRFLPRRWMRGVRLGVCRYCDRGIVSTIDDYPFSRCCGEPNGLWDAPQPKPWKLAR